MDPMSILSFVHLGVSLVNLYDKVDPNRKKARQEKQNKTHQKIAESIGNAIEPFAKNVKYENELLKEAMTTNFDELIKLSDDIDKAFNNISQELNSLNLKLDFISNSIVSLSNNINLISQDINILMNIDYKAGLKHLKIYSLTDNPEELKTSKDYFVKAYHIANDRKNRSDEHYQQYILSAFALSVTNYKYSVYNSSYKNVAIKSLKDIINEVIDNQKIHLAMDVIKLNFLIFLNEPSLRKDIELLYKYKISMDLKSFNFIDAKNSVLELTSLTNNNETMNNVLSITGDVILETDAKRHFMQANNDYQQAFNAMQNQNMKLSKNNYFEFAKAFNNEKILKYSFKSLYAQGLYQECEEFFNTFYIPDRDYRAKAYLLINKQNGNISRLNEIKEFIKNNDSYSKEIKQLSCKL